MLPRRVSLNEHLTLRSESVARAPRGSGISVDPARVREARLEAGLSLAQVAKQDVSRTFVHLIETGRSRPSKRVLALIARRTGKPMSYFMAGSSHEAEQNMDLASDLTRVAARVRRHALASRLSKPEVEALKLVELTLRQAAELIKSIPSAPTAQDDLTASNG
jgi:transcriptional regulator with XRE-family HTH domain